MMPESPHKHPFRSDCSPTISIPPPYTSNAASVVEKWAPGAQRQVPFVAFASFVIASICVMACILVLKLSDGQLVDSWPTKGAPVQPAVMLSMAAALANMSIRFMLFEGVVITWWKKAIRGTTVGELERIYDYGSNLPAAFQAVFSRHFNLVALASIMVSIVAIDGPLLQKASHVKTKPWSNTTDFEIQITPNATLADHPTGYSTGRTAAIGLMSSEFLTVAQQYNNRAEMNVSYTGCQGTCTTSVLALGLDVNCTTSTTPLNITTTPGESTDILSYAFDFTGKVNSNTITLNTTSRLTQNPSVLTTQICILHYAQVAYPVRLSNQTITLLPRTTNNETQKLLYLPYETTGMGTFPSSLGGIALLAQRKFGSTASLYMNGSPYELDSNGETALEYLDLSNSAAQTTNYTFLDATPDMLSSIREIMFRTALHISSPAQPQTSSGIDESTQTIYSSDFRYLAAALSLMIVAMLASSINLWGWWELGRAFTLGPFEIAKAFNAPFLEDARFFGSKERGFREIGGRPIRYGEFVGVEMGSVGLGLKSGDDLGINSDGSHAGGQSAASPLQRAGTRDGMARRTGWSSRVGGLDDDDRWVRFGMGIPNNYH